MHLDPDAYAAFVADPDVHARAASGDDGPLIVVTGAGTDHIADPGSLPVVVCWLGDELGGHGPTEADLIVSPDELDHLTALVTSRPTASTALAVLLRQTSSLDVDHGLAAESAVYSMLQGSAEFAEWRGTTTPTIDGQDEPTVIIDRADATLTVSLNRPHRHNAITRQLRDELCDALAVALLDRSIRSVRLTGIGPSFCSGGDLAEFGARPDPARAHLTRLGQSPARLIHRIGARTTAFVHGATLGGGLEMAAFAHRVVAHPDTRLGLPEVAIGLVPGAGGTVSIPRRVGRQRTAALALACRTIDTETALRWNLVDAVEPDDRHAARA